MILGPGDKGAVFWAHGGDAGRGEAVGVVRLPGCGGSACGSTAAPAARASSPTAAATAVQCIVQRLPTPLIFLVFVARGDVVHLVSQARVDQQQLVVLLQHLFFFFS